MTPQERAERVQRKLLELGIAIHNLEMLEKAFHEADLLSEINTLKSQLIKTNDTVGEIHSRISRLEVIASNERGDDDQHGMLTNSVWINIPEKGFEISAYLVTQKQWFQIMGYNPSHFKGDDLPVESVCFDSCNKFIQKLNASQFKYVYRLPTDGEWVYCSDSNNFKELKNIEDYAWVKENSEKKTHPVGLKKPTGIGLYDMYGNVWEWTLTPYNEFDKQDDYILRGGGWANDAPQVDCVRRGVSPPNIREKDLGFRLVRVKNKTQI